MLFTKQTLDGLTAGTVTRTYRRWTQVRPKVGSRFTTRAGMLRITAITAVSADRLTDADAVAAGFDSAEALRSWTQKKGSGDLYRIDLVVDGPDPRIALRAADRLGEADRSAIAARLDRMDAAADQPWTRRVLEQIRDHPAVVSTELAAAVGEDRASFKIRVRRLKALGLTESLEVGYRLSPRGEAFLADGGDS